MRRWGLGLVGLLIGVFVLPLSLRGATFEMKNGDVIVGELSSSLKIEPTFGGELEVPPGEIVSIEGERFTFKDGTSLKGRIKQETLLVKTRFGVVKLPVAELKMIRRGSSSTSPSP